MDIIAKNAKDTDIKYFGVEEGHCVNSHNDNTININTHVCLRTVNGRCFFCAVYAKLLVGRVFNYNE